MRLRLSIDHSRKTLLLIPSNRKSISDLIYHVQEKFNLIAPIKLALNGYELPLEEKIADLLQRDDEITYATYNFRLILYLTLSLGS